jgi:hypothetical protein
MLEVAIEEARIGLAKAEFPSVLRYLIKKEICLGAAQPARAGKRSFDSRRKRCISESRTADDYRETIM